MIRSLYYKRQLYKGMLIEKEHTRSVTKAKQIAEDHLRENIHYYKYYNPKRKNVKEYLIQR